ncbi:hypothetical protein ACHAXT_004729 [Thalassiosira profunda]
MRGNVSEPGKVVVVGSINQDLTTYAPSLPAPGQTILGSDFITTPGGKGANQAVAASIIGAVPDTGLCGVHMIGRVGDDVMGGALITGLRAKGVRIDEGEASVAGAHTGVASIVVDSTSGQNTIVVAPGANLALAEKDVESALGSLLESNSQRNVVLVQLEITPESALKSLATASMLGALTILNPAPAPKGWALTDEWFGTIDILVPNETELASLCGVSDSEVVTGEGEDAMARSLLERGVRQAVIVTLGARGAMIVRRNEEGDTQASAALDSSDDNLQTIMISEPADLPCKSETVVDAVGAGDAFCGALAAYLSRGVELEQAASMACGVASMSVRKRGAQESYPSAEDLPDCLRLDEDASTIDYTEESVAQRRKTVTFVTGNKNKLSEVQRLLSTSSDGAQQFPFDIDNRKLDLPELQGSPHEIALEKCKAASEQLQTAVITEDTCLCFRALKDLPGPYIKWFLDDLGHDGLNKLLHGFDDTRAYAMTIIGFCAGPGQEVKLFEGRTEGNIVPARGSLDFGWDPIFKPTKEEQGEGKQKTYAEMTKDEKNAISHRGRAFQKFRDYLLSNTDEVIKSMS